MAEWSELLQNCKIKFYSFVVYVCAWLMLSISVKVRESRIQNQWYVIFGTHVTTLQGRAKERSPSCEKVVYVCAWLVLSKSGPFLAQVCILQG